MGKTHRFYYGWVVVAVSFVTLFLTLGTRFSFGVFYVAILKEYDWGRAQTAGAFSLGLMVHAFFSIVTGKLIDRFGPRTLFPLGAIFLTIGLAFASLINAVWHLYVLFGVVLALGINTLAYAPHMSLIPRWFIRKRGLAGGLVIAGTGLGTLTIAPLIQFAIDNVGWRSSFLVLAGIIIGVVVPLTALFQRNSPRDVGQFPDGIEPPAREIHTVRPMAFGKNPQFTGTSAQWTLKAALFTRAFWWLGLANFTVGFTNNMLVLHQAAHVVDAGYTPSLAASIVGLVGLLRSGGGILLGLLSDRMGREIAYSFGSSAALVGILFLLLVRNTTSLWMLYAFVILFGFGFGSVGPIFAATTADLFPGNWLGRIMGTFSIGWGIGGALGAYLGGYFCDHLGNYTLPFVLAMISIILGVIGVWIAAPRHRQASSPLKGLRNPEETPSSSQ